jgi:hypothetical protein
MLSPDAQYISLFQGYQYYVSCRACGLHSYAHLNLHSNKPYVLWAFKSQFLMSVFACSHKRDIKMGVDLMEIVWQRGWYKNYQ